ncbi:MAG: hypothetical protein K9G67_14640 [Bacteroidales bacterium]|nr:hypothetical protein [Bacteroidales bacterium]MCF8351289.1 hypothetical protein [Bacteroidales bacterium]MCF8377590.1 hypothetical protein [Bacteroidales bacterium]MCF8401829.1 hypothetical protein [Bacteroidales bacterium]
MTFLEQTIKEKGPILSSKLIEVLTNKEKGLSKEAARKRLSRINGDIARITGLFSDRQILFHDKAIYNSPEYFEGIYDALKKAGKQYQLILQSLDFHYGQINKNQLAAYSINPIKNLKGHLTFHSALEKLEKFNLVHNDGENISLLPTLAESNPSSKRAKGIEVAKNFLLVQFNDWSRKIGLTSYNASKFHSEFGKYQFNFVSPTYAGTLPRYSSNKKIVPGFLVADILIGNTVTEREVEFFINKTKALKYQKQIANFIPFLIIESIDTNSLNSLKSEGIVIGFVNELFGEKYKDLLNSLIGLVTNAGAILKKNPDAYLDLITKLNKLVDGKTNNLRGDLFELAVGYYQGRVCNSIDIGKIINHGGEQREIDVLGFTANKVIVSECKGYNHKVDKDEIENWLGQKVPIIRKWILDQSSISDKEILFEYWSTGGFTEEAIILLESKKKNTKKYSIDFYGLQKMIEKSRDLKSKKFTEVLRDYYVKEI